MIDERRRRDRVGSQEGGGECGSAPRERRPDGSVRGGKGDGGDAGEQCARHGPIRLPRQGDGGEDYPDRSQDVSRTREADDEQGQEDQAGLDDDLTDQEPPGRARRLGSERCGQ